METASSPDLGSGFETPQVPKTCELVCIVMEIPSSPRFPRAVKCGNPWFHQGRDMETPSFPGLGAVGFGRGTTRKPQVSQAWAPSVSVGVPHGNPKFPPAWVPGRDIETSSFPKLGRDL
jgi:hypothetical protein